MNIQNLIYVYNCEEHRCNQLLDRHLKANSADPDQTDPLGKKICSENKGVDKLCGFGICKSRLSHDAAHMV